MEKSTRRCLGIVTIAAAALLASPASSGTDQTGDASVVAAITQPQREQRLRLYNTHTGERVDVVYRRGDAYLKEGVRALEHHLRDHRTGDVHRFDPKLFDVLADLAAAAGRPDGEFQVISGYRSPKTNEMLRSTRNGVAKKSLHMEAQALDVRLTGVSTKKLHATALKLGRGGVGFYPHQDFIHVDTGRVRRW